MIPRIFGKFTLLSSIIPIDNVSKDLKTVQDADLTVVDNETGWDRIKAICEKDDFGRVSPELQSIVSISSGSLMVGAVYGGVVNTRETYVDFVRNNQATSFSNHFEAKRELQNRMTLSFAKGAFKWGWRLCLFSTTYVVITTMYSTYRGKNGILEHTLAGTVAGSLYKFNLGPPAMLVGGIIGGALGVMAGVATNSLLQLGGMTMQEVRYWNYKWVKSRSDAYNSAYKQHIEKDQMAILTEREHMMKNSPADISTLDSVVEVKQ